MLNAAQFCIRECGRMVTKESSTCYGTPDATLDVLARPAAHLVHGALVTVDPHQAIRGVRCAQLRILVTPSATCTKPTQIEGIQVFVLFILCISWGKGGGVL